MAAIVLLATLAATPALLVDTLDGNRFDLAAAAGHPVIVNFWASWCVPCRAEMPVLDAYYRRHRADGLVMIGLSMDRDVAVARRSAATIAYPIAMADHAQQNGFPFVNELPVTYVIDAGGSVRARLTAGTKPLTEASLAALIDPLLASGRH